MALSWLRAWTNPHDRTPRRRRHARWTPQLEVLERRELPAVTVGANVDTTKTAGNENETAIALDPTNPNRLFEVSNKELNNSALLGGFSTDGGKTWTTRLIADGNDGLPQACCDAQATFDEFGNLFLSYLTADDNPEIALSTDGGKTFAPLNQFSKSNGNDQPQMAAGAGSVWLTFFNGSSQAASGAAVTGLGKVGAFSAPQVLPGSQAGNFGDIGIGPNGQVMVTWQNSASGQGPDTIMANVNPTGIGGTFGNAVTVSDTNVGAIDTALPAQSNNFGIDAESAPVYDRSGGTHNGRAYVVYTDAPSVGSAATDNFVRFSDDNGTTWSAPVRVSGDTGSNSKFLPSIVVDQKTGVVAVQWYDCRNDLGNGGAGDTDGVANDDAQLWVAFSTDGGQTFLPAVQVSTGTSNSADSEPPDSSNDRPLGYGDYTKSTAFNNGVFYPVWADNSNSTGNNPDGKLKKFDVYTAPVTITSGGGGGGGGGTSAPILVVAPQVFGPPIVNVYDAASDTLKFSFLAYDPRFQGGVRVAVGDVNGDGVRDIITAPGPTGGPDVRVWDGNTGQMINEFMAYDPSFTGGVFVAAGDVNGDGKAEIITGPDQGGGAQVKVFNGENGSQLRQFLAYSRLFFGGVRVASGDVNGDGFADIITGAGPGGGPHVEVFSGKGGGLLQSFMAYDPTFTGGVNVAAGDINADKHADIITGAGAGGGPHVKVIDGATGAVIRSFMAYPVGALFQDDALPFYSGVQVAAVDPAGTGVAEIVTSLGLGSPPQVKVFDPNSLQVIDSFFAFDPSLLSGLYVGGG